MAAESNHIPALDHFVGGANIQQGNPKSLPSARSGQSLAQFMRRMRSGRFTSSGAGDTTVTFSTALESSNVTVLLTGTGAAVPIIKTGTLPTSAGFVATCGGAGVVHWMAIDDGPTS